MGMLDEYGREVFGPAFESMSRYVVPVNITEPARWFLAENEKHDWDHTEDFHSVVSPWQFSWFEYKSPGVVNNNGRFVNEPRYTAGVWYACFEIPPDQEPYASKRNPFLDMISEYAGVHVEGDHDLAHDLPRKPRWTCLWSVCLKINGRFVRVGCRTGALDTQGQIIPKSLRVLPMPDLVEKDGKEIACHTVQKFLLPVQFALSLLHCKNVETLDRPVPPKVAAKRIKNGKPPGVTYKTLEIDAMRKQVRREMQPGETEIQRALHICRGHFRTYTEDKPLFGRVTGTFWIPMHARGSEKHGRVEKDYRVKAPR